MFGRCSGKWLGLGATYLCTQFPAASIRIPQTFGEREGSLRGLLSEQVVLCGLLSRRARGSWLSRRRCQGAAGAEIQAQPQAGADGASGRDPGKGQGIPGKTPE